jgi:hypothetical protein
MQCIPDANIHAISIFSGILLKLQKQTKSHLHSLLNNLHDNYKDPSKRYLQGNPYLIFQSVSSNTNLRFAEQGLCKIPSTNCYVPKKNFLYMIIMVKDTVSTQINTITLTNNINLTGNMKI